MKNFTMPSKQNGAALVVGAAIVWIRRRDVWGVKIRAFFEAGREQKAAAT